MEIITQVKHVRVSPRKAGVVASLVRGRQVNDALAQLRFVNKKAARVIIKLLNSAVANAQHNYNLNADNLLIKKIWVGKGVTFHRWLPRAHGRATPINKRTSHIVIVLDEIKDSGPRQARQVKVEAPVNLSDLSKTNLEEPADKKDRKNKKEVKNKEDKKIIKKEAKKTDKEVVQSVIVDQEANNSSQAG